MLTMRRRAPPVHPAPMAIPRGVATVLILLLLATACVPDAATTARPPAEPITDVHRDSDASQEPTESPLESSLTWNDCGEPFECSTLAVPLDHTDLRGPAIDLALIRLPAPPAARRIGSLVVNPGGPGGSGVAFVRHSAVDTIPAELRARFDIVGFDPRGVGASAGLDCGPDAVERFAEAVTKEIPAVLAAAQGLAEACGQEAAPLIGHVSTADVAADLDLLREALGDRRLTYLGYSYGTLIGAMYADRHPQQVRALVLDGAVDPAQDVAARARDKAAATDAALEDFLGWCADDARCPMLGEGDPRAVLDEALAAVAAGLVTGVHPSGSRRLSSGATLLVTSSLLTDRSYGWLLLAEGLAMAADEHDGTLLLAVFDAMSGDGGTDGEPEADPQQIAELNLAQLMAVNCLDVPAPPAEDYPALLGELEAASPLFGVLTLLSWAPCSYWAVPPVRTATAIAAPHSPPLVVIGTRDDPVTPFRWAEALADQLNHAVLLTRDGHGHTAFGSGNVCTDRTIMAYLLEETPPTAGERCG